MNLLIGVAFSSVVLWLEGPSANSGWSLLLLAVNGIVDWLWRVWKVEAWPDLRGGLAMAKRAAINVPVALLMPLWFKPPVDSARALAQFLTMTTGVLNLVFVSFAVPMFTTGHLLMQVPTAVFMSVHTPARVCTEGAMTPQGAPHIVAAWRWLNALCTGSARTMPAPGVPGCCWDVVVMWTLAMGLFVPSYIVWAEEYTARVEFSAGGLPRLTWMTVLVHGTLFVTAMSCFWVLLHMGLWA
eukprot:evm.model.scf_1210.3 EVM.evm.TU.scf_1210.3   scf_1210:38709-39431(+)